MKYLLPILISVLTFTICDAQSPWPQGKGGQYHQVSFTLIPSYSKLFGKNESIQLERAISDNTLQYYGEVGILDNFTVSASVPFKLLKSGDLADTTITTPVTQAGSYAAFGDIEITAKYRLLSVNNFSLAVLLNVGIPTSSFDTKTGLRSGFNALKIQPTLSVGYSAGKLYAYGFGAVGWYNRSISNRLYLGAEVGFKFTDQIILAAFASTSRTLNSLNAPIVIDSPLLFANDQEYTALTLKVIGELIPNRFGLFAAFGGGTGNLVAISPAITFGVFVR